MKNLHLRIAEEVLKVAEELVFADDYEYIYDPDHKKRPGGGYIKTENGWSKGKKEKEESKGKTTDKSAPNVEMTSQQKELDEKSNSDDFNDVLMVAINSNTHPSTLNKLSKGKAKIRSAVARNSNTSQSTLRKLSKDKSKEVRGAIAQNKNAPVDIIENLSNDKEEYVRGQVAYSSHTPSKIIEKLSNDNSGNVREYAAMNHNCPKETLDKLSNDKEPGVRSSVAYNPNTSVEILNKLSNDVNENVRRHVARNKNTTIETLDKLSADSDVEVREIVAKNEKTTTDMLHRMAKKELRAKVMEAIIENEKTSSQTLQTICDKKWIDDDARSRVLRRVASHFNATPELLDKLSVEKNTDIKSHVAGNHNTSVKTLDKLSNDDYPFVKKAVARNPNTSPETLDKLSKAFYPDYYSLGGGIGRPTGEWFTYQIRSEVGMNPNTPQDTLNRLIKTTSFSSNGNLARDISTNPSLSAENIDELCNKNYREKTQNIVRYNAAVHPNTSLNTLKKLSNDKDEEVASAAKESIKKRNVEQSNSFHFDITKLSPELREKVKDWDAEDIAKFIGWLKKQKEGEI